MLTADATPADIPRTGLGSPRVSGTTKGLRNHLETGAFWLFIATLAWAPFPLGSNRPWAWSLLALLVAFCWGLWLASGGVQRINGVMLTRLWLPATLAVLCLFWGCIQAIFGLSLGPSQTLWHDASTVLANDSTGAISRSPWQTIDAVLRLATYVMAACLACVLCVRPKRAATMLSAVILIGAFYAVYAFAIDVRGLRQFELFYAEHRIGDRMAGPFVNRNSYATYAGLIVLCAALRSADVASRLIVFKQGARQLLLSLTQFLAGSGMLPLLAFFLSLSALIATGSRAGFMSTMLGLAAAAALFVFASAQRISWSRVLFSALALILILATAIAITGERLTRNLGNLVAAEDALGLRRDLWLATLQMIRDAPWTGYGLGTYETVYPLYTNDLIRLTVDKAHNDFLEFAAGAGLPAAILWWFAMLWLTSLCLRAVLVRKYERIYPLAAVGATVLVGFHALFDFSLQMPAIAMTYAVLLGLGIAQSFSSREI